MEIRARLLVLGMLTLAATLAAPAAASAGQVRAGAAAVDTSWHVGASAGQYASDGTPVDPANGTYNPTAESTRRSPSYGMQSRLQVRALVIEGPDGTRTAIVKNDNYIPQDLVYRRAGQLLEERGDCGIAPENLTMAVTHNHSSPYYSSTSFGVWTFQDVFDVRFFNYLAERMYQAVERACDGLVPVRVGASVGQFDKTHRHSFGPAIADDGTPAGYPNSNTDHDLTVIRFDDVSDPAHPKPLANLLNFSLHPEFLNGNDLISADYLGPLQRMTDRATGAINIWTQGAVGTSEPERSTYHSLHERLEFTHREYAQAEYGARLMSDEIIGLWRGIGAGEPEDPDRYVPFMTDFPVQVEDRWYPGPFSHPYPGVSNCRTDKGLEEGDPQLPVVGLPTCQGVQSGLAALNDEIGLPPPPDAGLPGIDPGLSTDDFQAANIPVPENYGAPAYGGLEEDIDVHLQVIRLGGILLTICSCEQWYDQSTNIETRTDKVAGNEYLGYDWGAQCTDVGDGTWSCPDPNDTSRRLPPVSDLEYRRMRAQVNNPANGWNDAENALYAESEPVDPAQIKGNYAHDDRCGPTPLTPGNQPCGAGDSPVSANLGYELTVPISMANDYNGYIATYREYQRGDHYRKALTAWGPHSSDYLATRLVTMARQLKQPALVLPKDQQQEAGLAAKAELDTAVNDARAAALGEAGADAIAAYEAALPDDRAPAKLIEPGDVERFGAAFFTWNGGSNFTDNPVVRVERKLPSGGWQPYADQSGELPVTLEFPEGEDVPSYLSGDQEWRWTAHFEAFVSRFDTGERPIATTAGTYRFVVDGMARRGGAPRPYHLASREFQVRTWSGITVEDFRRDEGGGMSFRVGPRSTYPVRGGGPDLEATIGPVDYPDSYDSPIPFIRDERTAVRDPQRPDDPDALEWYCFACSFRPWIDSGNASSARVTVIDADDGSRRTFAASPSGERWRTARELRPGEIAIVDAGGVLDEWGNRNGALAGPLILAGGGGGGGGSGGGGSGGGSDSCTTLIAGTAGSDRLVGVTIGELLAGYGGDDVLRGGDGDDCLLGGDGADRLNGGRGSDRLEDGFGPDRATGRGGADRLIGGGGIDRLAGGPGSDRIISVGRGRDVIRCGPGRDRARVGVVDNVRGCERVRRGR